MRASTRRTSTTAVAIVGEGARACVERLAGSANVATLVPDCDDPPLDRAVAAWNTATRTHTPYFVHDADPLGAVVDAWVRRYHEEGAIGELEVVVADTLLRWRAGSLDLPDYYLVLDAEAWGATRRHWYLGVLRRAATARVVPALHADAAVVALPRLGAGRWWPDLDELLDGIDRVVPDKVTTTA